ncbi:glutathione S-transferase T3-like [Chenopodium quinoa]|uniref:glutathione S-transferase T3-like n=1 Tax=Chenopodium quinoa TaxID=63459 RepID=UPI000B78BF72|nr:glutathione S-transferase T3-like [Chenopodium quinoa]
MDPNNPNFSQMSQHFSDLGDDFITNPNFQVFLQRLGNTSLQNPSQQQTPSQFSTENTYYDQQTPQANPTENAYYDQQRSPAYEGSNSQYDESQEENVPETPQYPAPHPRIPTNQPLAKASRIWSVAEDEVLIGLYLKLSEDALVGTSQKASELWRKVHADYSLAQAEKPHILPLRPMKSLETHWRRMAAGLLQWSSCYEEAGKLPEIGSGYNEADRIKNSYKLFYISTNPQHNFAFPHGVEMVNKDPKWRTKLRWGLSKEERKTCGPDDEEDSSGSGKRSRAEGEISTHGYSSEGLPRPDGVKKTKAKRNKGKAVVSESAFFNIGEQMKACTEVREKRQIYDNKS